MLPRRRVCFGVNRSGEVALLDSLTQPTDMPLTEMARRIAGSLERLGERDLFMRQRILAGPRDVVSEWMPPSEATPARWRTDWCGGIEPVETNPFPRHRIKVRRLLNGVSRIPDVAIA